MSGRGHTVEAQAPSNPDGRVALRIVNLDRATARSALMTRTLKDAGIEPVFFAARDLKDPAVAERLARLPDAGPWGPFAPHDKACTISHLDALGEFLETGADYALMLEDDVFVSSELKDWLSDMSWWPADADVVKLERWLDDRLMVGLDMPVRTHLGRKVCRLRTRHSGTGGYMVSRSGARRILDGGAPDMPIDHLLFNRVISPVARSLTTYQVTPALIQQGNEPADQPAQTRDGPVVKRGLTVDLRRGWADVAPVPGMLARIVTGRGTWGRIAFADTTSNTSRAAVAARPVQDRI